MIRRVLYGQAIGKLNNIIRKQDEEEVILYHVEHCIEYLRSSIMCGHGLNIKSKTKGPLGRRLSIVTDQWAKL